MTTTQVTRNKDAQGFSENKEAAREGGEIAGEARRLVEKRTGKPVLSNRNYLEQPESDQLLAGEDEEDDLIF